MTEALSSNHLKKFLTEGSAVVVFYSPRCPHCVAMYDAISTLNAAQYPIMKYNVLSLGGQLHDDPVLGANLPRINGFPTILFIQKNLKQFKEYSGPRSPEAIAAGFDGFRNTVRGLGGGGSGPLHGFMRQWKEDILMNP